MISDTNMLNINLVSISQSGTLHGIEYRIVKRTRRTFNWQFTSAYFFERENCAKNIDVHRHHVFAIRMRRRKKVRNLSRKLCARCSHIAPNQYKLELAIWQMRQEIESRALDI